MKFYPNIHIPIINTITHNTYYILRGWNEWESGYQSSAAPLRLPSQGVGLEIGWVGLERGWFGLEEEFNQSALASGWVAPLTRPSAFIVRFHYVCDAQFARFRTLWKSCALENSLLIFFRMVFWIGMSVFDNFEVVQLLFIENSIGIQTLNEIDKTCQKFKVHVKVLLRIE